MTISKNMTAAPKTYITRVRHNRMRRAAIAAILMTADGANRSKSSIARQVGCGTPMVTSVKDDLMLLGVLGLNSGTASIFLEVPQATYDDLQWRLFDLMDWFDLMLSMGIDDSRIVKGKASTTMLHRTINKKGNLPRLHNWVERRILALEKLPELPDFDLSRHRGWQAPSNLTSAMGPVSAQN